MGVMQKINVLGDGAKWDSCGMSKNADHSLPGICYVHTGERACSLMKVLMSNKCIYNCRYCINRKERRCQRSSFEPDELVRAFMHYYERNLVEGLFLSSGVDKDPDYIMEKMIAAARILRKEKNYHGYLHLKIIPGTSYSLVKQACELATRTSMNIEAPKNRLSEISNKDFKYDIIRRFSWLKRLHSKGLLPAGYTTQFIVGAAGESDREIIETLEVLYNNFGLKRAYFSAFFPVKGTPFEIKRPESVLREYRLYQADYLVRKYEFSFKDIPLNDKGNLDLKSDPKYLLALENRKEYPVNINKASKSELLKVPGIGPASAERIIKLRRKGVIFKELKELSRIGVAVKRAFPFVNLGERQKVISEYLNDYWRSYGCT